MIQLVFFLSSFIACIYPSKYQEKRYHTQNKQLWWKAPSLKYSSVYINLSRSSLLDASNNFHCSILFYKKFLTLSAIPNNSIHIHVTMLKKVIHFLAVHPGLRWIGVPFIAIFQQSLINKELVLCSTASSSASYLFFQLLFKIIIHLFSYDRRDLDMWLKRFRHLRGNNFLLHYLFLDPSDRVQGNHVSSMQVGYYLPSRSCLFE